MEHLASSTQEVIFQPALFLMPLLPLIGAALVYLLCNRKNNLHAVSGWLATFFSLSSFAVAIFVTKQLNTSESILVAQGWKWFQVGAVNVDFNLSFDKLTSVMCLIITGVGSLIHLYAIGYMQEDQHRPRFFSYLNLFLFAMLLLVLGNNLLVMFVGWEGVGLCSYLLIGFWFKEMPNANAGQKAFVVNRIGDAGFLLGIFTLIMATGTVNFSELSGLVKSLPPGVIELAAGLLFIGACGKSAQIPLFVWLPDAMAGPTPVSALIHAATMVTAGVYMIARLAFLYSLAPQVSLVILVIGTLTALFAATIALVQYDIKKVLAYSTVSQLGYMFMAMGVGAYSNGIFHVVTHAFFKACLFMGAGSVIMGCHHEQDMRQFGGLRKFMPLTFVTYLVATLAIAGIPYTSGFFSKDAILWSVYSSSATDFSPSIFSLYPQVGYLCWSVGLLTAFITAFYMTRSLMMTFFGEYRGHAHPHESPWVVTLPLIVLALLSAVYGLFQGEHFMHYLQTWTRGDIAVGHEVLAENPVYTSLEHLSMVIAVIGVLLSVLLYSQWKKIPTKISQAFPWIHQALQGKWWIDELYAKIIVGPVLGLAKFFFSAIDRVLVDGFVNGAGVVVDATGGILRRLQVGRVSGYAIMMLAGSLFLILFWMLL